MFNHSLVFCGKNTQCDKPLKIFAKPGCGEQMIPGLCESVFFLFTAEILETEKLSKFTKILLH